MRTRHEPVMPRGFLKLRYSMSLCEKLLQPVHMIVNFGIKMIQRAQSAGVLEGFVQFFIDKAATMFNSTTLFACLVPGMFMNWSDKYFRWLIEHGNTISSFLPLEVNSDLMRVCPTR